MSATAKDIVAFWREAGPAKWFAVDPALDAAIADRFKPDLEIAAARLRAGSHEWERSAEGALALLILTDQFPRNIYRGEPSAFAFDPLAVSAARRAVAARKDREIEGDMRVFCYLPFTHSEATSDQEMCVELTEAAFGVDSEFARHARAHRSMIAKFGRFPERNRALGREPTPEEQAWLDAGGYEAELAAV